MFSSNAREKRKQIFDNTINLCETDEFLKESIENSVKNQILIRHDDILENKEIKKNIKAKIIISEKRTFEAAMKYKDKKVCIHNFASATNAGGGVAHGSNAQEECLCRCSTLYKCISSEKMKEEFYNKHRQMLRNKNLNSLYNDDCIYTPDVIIFKSDTDFPQILDKEQWKKVDVITCAAPNLREKPTNFANPEQTENIKIEDTELEKLHINRMNKILTIAHNNNAQVVILGAFGCGAFQNPPKIVSKAICKAIEKHIYNFETIELAIYSGTQKNENYQAFKQTFKYI